MKTFISCLILLISLSISAQNITIDEEHIVSLDGNELIVLEKKLFNYKVKDIYTNEVLIKANRMVVVDSSTITKSNLYGLVYYYNVYFTGDEINKYFEIESFNFNTIKDLITAGIITKTGSLATEKAIAYRKSIGTKYTDKAVAKEIEKNNALLKKNQEESRKNQATDEALHEIMIQLGN